MNIRQCAELREFNHLYKGIENSYHAVALRAGMSDSAFWILYTIAELGDGCLQKDIAERYAFSPQTISSSVRSLEKKGFIVLKHGKGRNMHLTFTELGNQFIEEKIAPLAETENKIFEILGTKDSAELLRLTRRYHEIFQEQIAENYP